MKEFPLLYHNGSHGELRSIRIWADKDTVYTEYGIVDGKMQTSSELVSGKNIGRSNETTPQQQAELMAASKWNEKLRKKYRLDKEGTEKIFQPMLAKPLNEKLIKFPGYVQPKLDGLRCIAYWKGDKVVLMSRGNKEYNLANISQALSVFLPVDRVLDGELYVHGVPLETINSWVPLQNQSVKLETECIVYHVYDNIDIRKLHQSFHDRSLFLDTLREFKLKSGLSSNKYFDIVDTVLISDMASLDKYEEELVDQGYEGAIWRNKAGIYKFGSRSSDLIKIKRFEDTEFKVLDVVDGVGTYKGCAIFICQNDVNPTQTFECTIATTFTNKMDQFANKEKYIGKILTVKHIGRTMHGIPRNPVGKCFRLIEDL